MADDAPEQSSKTEDPSRKSSRRPTSAATWSRARRSPPGSCSPGSAPDPRDDGAVDQRGPRRELHGAPRQRRSVRGRRRRPSGSSSSGLASAILMVALVPLAVLMVFAVAANLVQHRPLLSLDPITPKLSKISPIDGFRGCSRREALVNFVKGLVKIGVVARRHVLRALARARPARARWSPPIRR